MRAPMVNPLRLLFGPIFQKEVRSSGRRRGTYLARTFTALGLLGAVAFAFIIWAIDGHPSGLARMQALQSLAPALAMVVMWFQFVIIGLMAPQLTSGGICDERRAQTLSALLTTPLRPSEIVFGKLSSPIVQILILSLLAMPLLLAIRIFGGLTANFVLGGTAIVLSTAILGASFGLMLSLWSRRAQSAAGSAVLMLIVAQLAPILFESLRVYTLQRYFGISAYLYDNVYATCSPAILFNLSYSTAMGLEPREVYLTLGSRTFTLGPAWAFNALYNLGVAILAAAFTSIMLRRTMRRMAAEAPPVIKESRRARRTRLRQQSARAAATTTTDAPAPEPAFIPPPAHRPSREVRGNPVLWRELRQQTYGSRKKLALFALAAAAGLALLYWRVGIDESGVHMCMAIFGLLALLAQAAILTIGPLSAEREANTWEALLATPLTGWQIIWAKYLGALRVQWFIPTVMLAHFVIAIAAGVFWPPAIVLLVLIIAGPLLFFTATAQLFAVIFRRATTATVLNIGLGLTLYLGPWVLAGLLHVLSDHTLDLFDSFYGVFNFAYNPGGMLATLVERSSDIVGRGPRNTFYIADASVSRFLFAAVVIAVFVVYVLASLAILAFAARLFTRCSGRAS